MMGLRLVEGIDDSLFAQETGVNLNDILHHERLNLLVEEGLLVREEGRLRATLRGRLCLNAVIGEIVNK
jgi:oxygen-independent coproporphyrinogen-3 oxidase